ncbi:MAG: hypothetical protein LJE59_14100 [Chromatiaceae bacterium]|jgi:hypothetical protein|nr:hypothetical protein [Chromatiaceae bacterium]
MIRRKPQWVDGRSGQGQEKADCDVSAAQRAVLPAFVCHIERARVAQQVDAGMGCGRVAVRGWISVAVPLQRPFASSIGGG